MPATATTLEVEQAGNRLGHQARLLKLQTLERRAGRLPGLVVEAPADYREA